MQRCFFVVVAKSWGSSSVAARQEYLIRARVAVLVPFESLKVIHGLFANGHCEYKAQRSNVGGQESNLEGRDELGQGDEEKVEVEKEFELLV